MLLFTSLCLNLPGPNILPGVQTVTEYDTSENCTSIPPPSATNSSRSSMPSSSARKHRLSADSPTTDDAGCRVPRRALSTHDSARTGNRSRIRVRSSRASGRDYADSNAVARILATYRRRRRRYYYYYSNAARARRNKICFQYFVMCARTKKILPTRGKIK